MLFLITFCNVRNFPKYVYLYLEIDYNTDTANQFLLGHFCYNKDILNNFLTKVFYI